MAHQEPGRGARRLGVMLRHSTHLLFGLLWAVAMIETIGATNSQVFPHRTAGLVLGVLEGVLYLAGLLYARRPRSHPSAPDTPPRSLRSPAGWRAVGRGWLASLVLLWMILCALSSHWLWLAFPLYFLVFFITANPWRWALVAVMAGWSAASGLARPHDRGIQQVVGPLVGALVAVIAWIVLEQLRANVREQERLVQQVRATQQQLLDTTEQRARDQERERLSRDIHDTLAQGLNSIVMLSRSSAARHPELGAELSVIERTARDNLAHARTMMHGVSAPTNDTVTAADGLAAPSAGDDADGLAHELRRLVDDAQTRERVIGSGVRLGFIEEGTPAPLDADAHHALVMGVRSLLANVVQHAHANRAQVSLTWQGDHVALDVVDDGRGFDTARTTGYGLAALRDRLHEVGATMEVTSEPGRGCSVAITAPLRSSARPAVPGAGASSTMSRSHP